MIIPSMITRQGMPRAGLPRAADRPLTSPAELPAASTRCEHVARRRDSSSTIIRERREAAPRSDVRGKFERTGRRTRPRGVAADEPQRDHRRPLQCLSVEDGDGVPCAASAFVRRCPAPARRVRAMPAWRGKTTVHRTFANALGAAASPASPPEAGSLCDHHDRVRAPHRRKARKPDSARGLGLELDAFGQTLHARQLAHGLVHHADRGSVPQYPLRRRPCRSWRPPVRRRGRRQQRTRSKA